MVNFMQQSQDKVILEYMKIMISYLKSMILKTVMKNQKKLWIKKKTKKEEKE